MQAAYACMQPAYYDRTQPAYDRLQRVDAGNNLPATLRNPNIEFVQFKRLLNVFLFGETVAHQRLFVDNAPCIH